MDKAPGWFFSQGGKGHVEDCQIWGNKRVGVVVQDDGSKAAIAGCKCAGGRAGVLYCRFVYFCFNQPLTAMPLLLPALLNIARRIYDGNGSGVVFAEGGKGRVEGCQICGNDLAGVRVQGDGSEAVVVGCKCAGV